MDSYKVISFFLVLFSTLYIGGEIEILYNNYYICLHNFIYAMQLVNSVRRNTLLKPSLKT